VRVPASYPPQDYHKWSAGEVQLAFPVVSVSGTVFYPANRRHVCGNGEWLKALMTQPLPRIEQIGAYISYILFTHC
jgi:hypothetical protein